MPTPAPRHTPHPLHAILLAFPVALFPGALLADVTFLNSAETQWSNFAAWLIVGGLVTGGLALVWAAISAARGRARRLYPILLATLWVVGLVNAFQHSRDGWSAVGTTGLALSIVASVLALLAGWAGYAPTNGRARA